MEQINNKNKRLTVIVGALLLVIGISFAYFLATTLINGTGASTKITTARINGATIQVDGNIEFEDLDILPGHKNISSVKLTATGNNQTVVYNLIWRGTNGLNTPLNYTVYKTTTLVASTSTCNQVSGVVNGMSTISESCTISNMDKLGSVIASGTINKSEAETKVTLIQDEMINATKSGTIVYYYVILEYPNLNESQDIDMGGTFEGLVTVEGSTTQADISVVGIYQESEDGSYTKVNEIPSNTSSYTLNSEKSSCTNNAKPIWNVSEWSLEVNNLTQSGTDCNLYFDKYKTIAQIIPTLNAKTETPDFSQTATTDEGVYAVEDGMYTGTSYYWRGAATTNYVKFGGYCWRIVRINGDGTLRLIYDGTTCHQNGEATTDSIAVQNVAYNEKYDRSEYVGWTYEEGLQRPSNNATATSSNAKVQTEKWYNEHLANYSDKIADGKFCNDRNVASGYTWESQPSDTFYYVGYKRLYTDYQPTLSCNLEDVYNLKVSLITSDELLYAGGKEGNNKLYYLYNGYDFWTISPYGWSEGNVYMFYTTNDGYIGGHRVDAFNYGIRPVINLRSDIQIKATTNGTINNPYVVL